MKIELDGIVVDGKTPLPNGDIHRVSKVEGWWGGPDVRGELNDLIGEHGAAIAYGKLSAREPLLIGNTVPGPGRTAWQAMRYLKWGRLLGRTGTLRVFEPDGRTLRAEVARRPGTRVRQDIIPTYAYWEVPLVAPDPRKYGDDLLEWTLQHGVGNSNMAATITPGGEFAAIPERIEISGSGVAPISIENETLGQKILLHGDIGGVGYVIYPRIAEVWRGGEKRFDLLDISTSQFWQLGHGTSSLRVRRHHTSTGEMTARVFYRPAYLD